MKTISMPLEMYEADIKKAEEKACALGRSRGFKNVVDLIRDHVLNGYTPQLEGDPESIKQVQTLIKDLKAWKSKGEVK